jgi:outer membrane lipoprotein-sorting protein
VSRVPLRNVHSAPVREVDRDERRAFDLIARMERAYRSLDSLRAHLTLTCEGAGPRLEMEGPILLKKPNLVRIALSGDRVRTIVSDGESLWITKPEAGRCKRLVAHPEGPYDVLWALPVRMFFHLRPLYIARGGVYPRLEKRNLGGKPEFRVLVVDSPRPNGGLLQRYTFYVGGDDLVRRMTAELTSPEASVRLDTVLTDFQGDITLTSEAFTYTPPEGIEVYDPDDDAQVQSVVLRSTYRPDFQWTTLSGSQTLQEPYRGKRATLLSFWGIY